MKKETFQIEGMTCSACSNGIERSLKRKSFIHNIQVNLISKTATVEFDDEKSHLEDIFLLIKKMGYEPYCQQDRQQKSSEVIMQKQFSWRIVLACICMFSIVYLAMVGMMFPAFLPPLLLDFTINTTLQIVITVFVIILGLKFYIKGFKGLWHKNPNMDSLIAISTSAAFVYSLYLVAMGFDHGFYFESVVVIITLVMVGKGLEDRAKKDANHAIRTLLEKQQKEAIVLKNGMEIKIPIQEIAVNDVLRILPGSHIPVDGVVLEGEAYIDESMLSGEALPLFKQNGDKLYAGSLNIQTSFMMQATTDSQNSTLQSMIKLIEEAVQSKTKMTRLADRVASIFVPSVMMIACLAGLFWMWREDFILGFEIFIAVLVISCPCALGLATPMAIMIGATLANKKGLFFKHAAVMERAKEVSCVVFDKTGTLTHASLSVAKISPFCVSDRELLQIAASIEQGSEHLIAQAILKEAKQQGVELLEVQQCESVAGYGMKALIKNQHYWLGNAEWCDGKDAFSETAGLIAVFVKREDILLGAILLEDRLKDEAKKSIDALQKRGIKVHIMSGDQRGNVERIAKALNVSSYYAQSKPKDKLEFVKSLKKQGEVVMMVGDGINDVAALEMSDVSVSFSHASDMSYQSADVIICNGDVGNAYRAIVLGEAIVINIKQNLFWAFCYNVIAIPLACGVLYDQGILLNPMIAAAAMSLSSLSVVLNAQRLRRFYVKGLES